MHFVLFDEIQETHTVTSLARALRARGHRVTRTGPVWHGHHLPQTPDELALMERALRACLQDSPDVVFNFRASSLPPALVHEISRAGARSQVWLPDDPVLHRVCYSQVVESYDDILHCGGEPVLQFYEEKHGRSGVNFPFWTGWQDWPELLREAPEHDLVFLGNCDGPVRSARYSLVAGLPFRSRIYGRVPQDPHQISGGVLDGERAVAIALSRAAVALNIPQYFSDYAGSEYDFPELADLGHFQYPSRVIQYARLGLPVVSLQPGQSEISEFLTASHRNNLIQTIDELLEPDVLAAQGERVRQRFHESFSAESRARLLEDLVTQPETFTAMTIAERATCFAAVDSAAAGTAVRPTIRLSPIRVSDQHVLDSSIPDLPVHLPRRVLVVSHQNTDSDGGVHPHNRALRQLGHDVFHLDSSRHPALVDPATALVATDFLSPILDRFQPDMVVVAAPAAIDRNLQELLAANSLPIIRLGANTTLEPGVDRAFSLDTPSTANIAQTQVVCVADASRSDDIALLQNHFEVQVRSPTRANGDHHLPPSAPGRRTVWRSGAIHVFFTHDYSGADAGAQVMTDALEAMSSSRSVLCIQHFDGVESFFEPGVEVIVFRDATDLVGQLVALAEQPHGLTAMRRRGFERLASEHLLEHRWTQLLAELDMYQPATAATGGAVDRPRRVVLSGYFGAGNVGDEVILRSLIDGISKRDPSLQIAVAAENPALVEQLHGRPSFPRRDIAWADVELASSSAVVLGGGGLWHDYSLRRVGGPASMFDDHHDSLTGYAKVPLLGAMRGLPFYVFGVGVGPIGDPQAGPILRHISRAAAGISVRDQHSKALLAGIDGWDQQVDVDADLAYALPIPKLPASNRSARPQLVVSLRPWQESDAESFEPAVARALQRCVDELDCDLVGLPMQHGRRSDQWALERVFAMVESSGVKKVLDWVPDIDAVTRVLQSADAVLAMRLHAALLAHRVGRPVIGLSYDPKVRAHFDELGVPHRALSLSVSAAEIFSQLAAAIDGDEHCDEIAAGVAQAERQAERALDTLVAELASAPAPSGPIPIIAPKDTRSTTADRPLLPDELALDQVQLTSGSTVDDTRTVAFDAEVTRARVVVNLRDSAPKKGDYVEARYELPGSAEAGQSFGLQLRAPYVNPSNAGRLQYEVYLGDTLLLTEDITLSREINSIRAEWAGADEQALRVRVHALRDCEPWSWGQSGRVELLHLSHRSCEAPATTAVVATSPAAQILIP